jgi:hypothetical protein
MYRVIKTNHDKDQMDEAKQLTPFYWKRGREVICRGMGEEEAKKYADHLQHLHDVATRPFRFTTYHHELDYPEKTE